MNELQIFNNEEFGEIRSIIINDEPWFVGKYVAKALGYKDTVNALKKHVDNEDKGVANCHTPGGMQNLTVINESGVYTLVFGSKLPTAKKFKHWITSEVLPALRKTGSYSLRNNQVSTDPVDIVRSIADALEAQRNATKEIKDIQDRQEQMLQDQSKELIVIKNKINAKPDDDAITVTELAEVMNLYSESGLPHGEFIAAVASLCKIRMTKNCLFDGKDSQAIISNVAGGGNIFLPIIYLKPSGQDKIIDWCEANLNSCYSNTKYKRAVNGHEIGDIKDEWFSIGKKKYRLYNQDEERLGIIEDWNKHYNSGQHSNIVDEYYI